MNNRELATLIWLVVLIVVMLVRRDTRGAIVGLIRAALAPRVLFLFLVLVGYVAGLVWLAARVGLWSDALRADAVVWFVTSAVGLFGAALERFRGAASLQRLALAALGTTLFVEVFVNLYVFPLAAELALLPFMAAVLSIQVVAEADDEHTILRKPLNALIGLVGIGLATFVIYRLVTGLSGSDVADTARKFAVPIWLTLGTLPFIAALGTYAPYENAFAAINWASDDRTQRRRAKLAVVRGLRLRVRHLQDFNSMWCKQLVRATTRAERRNVIARFRAREPEPPDPDEG